MLLNIKRLSLTLFFIVLTLSIGLVSVNLPLLSYAQNNILGQDGNGLAEQIIDQSQSFEQDGQVVSGDYTVLSGNNILCTKGNNLDELSNSIGNCDLNPMPNDGGVGSGDESGTLYISSFLRINCSPHGVFVSCPNPDGKIVIEDKTNGELLAVFNPVTYNGRPNHYTVEYPVDHKISVAAGAEDSEYWEAELPNIVDNYNACSGKGECTFQNNYNASDPDTYSNFYSAVSINFHYSCTAILCG